jgi:hypothetical protein
MNRTAPAHTIVIGDGGARLADVVESWGYPLPARVDVPAAKILSDSTQAFYSPHVIGQRNRGSLRVPEGGDGPVLVLDDCVQTGMTFDAVVAEAGVTGGAVVTGICNEATLERLTAAGWEVTYGVLLPGPTYPESYSTDLFCIRDFVATDAVRFADGTSTSYSSGGDWLNILYGDATTAEAVRSGWLALAHELAEAGIKP